MGPAGAAAASREGAEASLSGSCPAVGIERRPDPLGTSHRAATEGGEMATASAARRGRWRGPAMNSCPLFTRPTLELLACPHCGGRLRLIATLHDPVVIPKLLAHLGMARSGPSPCPAPARALIGSTRERRPSSCWRRAASWVLIRPVQLPLLSSCRLTAAVCAPSIPLTAGRARSARPEANVRCACGSSGAAVCGAGGVMTWERGRGEGARGRGGR